MPADSIDLDEEPSPPTDKLLTEIQHQVGFAQLALRDIQIQVNDPAYAHCKQSGRLWASLQAVVTCAGIMRQLWDSGSVIEVLGALPPEFDQANKLRNDLLHPVQRLREWNQKTVNSIHVDFVLGDPAGLEIEDSAKSLFRSFDPATYKLYYWGHIVDISELSFAIGEIPLRLQRYRWQQQLDRQSAQADGLPSEESVGE